MIPIQIVETTLRDRKCCRPQYQGLRKLFRFSERKKKSKKRMIGKKKKEKKDYQKYGKSRGVELRVNLRLKERSQWNQSFTKHLV